MTKAYSVVIPTHNEGSELPATVGDLLDSLNCCSRHSAAVEVIVVNDQCTDGSVEDLLEWLFDDSPVVVLTGDQRLGLTGAKRLGAAHAQGDMLVFADSHCRFGERWLHHLEDGMNAMGGPEAGLFGPAMRNLKKSHLAPDYGVYWPTPLMWRTYMDGIKPGPDGVRPNRHALVVQGNGQAIKRELYEEIGGFDDGMIAPWGGEDEELCLRLWRYGYQVTILPQWQMWHLFRGNQPHYELPYYVQIHNSLRVAVLHLDDERYKKVLRAHLNRLIEKTSGPEWDDFDEILRYDHYINAVWHIHRAYPETRRRVEEHAALSTRSIDEIFERFGMDW